jgi:enoyl-CoA hydratase/carnithine racemase
MNDLHGSGMTIIRTAEDSFTMAQELLVENHGAVRVLTMNRPEKMNALNNALTVALLDALQAADRDESVHALILTGAGRGFCAGADVTEFKDMTTDNPDLAQWRADLTTEVHAAFTRVDLPILCAVNGAAMGGGCGLAIAGDMAVAAESATFGYPETRRNAVAAVVMANLVRQVGRKAAYELVSLGEKKSALRALELGMVNRVVPDERLMAETLGMAQAIAGQTRSSQRATKRLFHRVADMRLLDALEIGRDANVMMRAYTIKGTV